MVSELEGILEEQLRHASGLEGVSWETSGASNNIGADPTSSVIRASSVPQPILPSMGSDGAVVERSGRRGTVGSDSGRIPSVGMARMSSAYSGWSQSVSGWSQQSLTAGLEASASTPPSRTGSQGTTVVVTPGRYHLGDLGSPASTVPVGQSGGFHPASCGEITHG